MLMLNVPATVGLIVLAAADRAAALRARRVHAADTAATAAALQFYALGLVGYSVVRIASPTFYALGRNRDAGHRQRGDRGSSTRCSTSCWCAGFGFRGLALGTSIAALFNAGTLLVLLRRAAARAERHGGSPVDILRIVVAAAVMGGAAIVSAGTAANAGCRASGYSRANRPPGRDDRRVAGGAGGGRPGCCASASSREAVTW